MDKTKKSPLPDKTSSVKPTEKSQTPRTPDPTFVRGTIDPPTKKEAP